MKLEFHNLPAVIGGCVGLVLVYVFQDQLFHDPFSNFIYNPQQNNYPEFEAFPYVILKALRFILNDGFAMLVIFGLFGTGKYLKFAAWIFLVGFAILLPLYLIMVLNFYDQTYSFLNHLHRMILNPVLMMLLIPAFYAQRFRNR